MPQTLLLFYVRRPDLTPVEFEKYLTEHYLSLMKEVMGPHFPSSATFQFVLRVGSGVGDRLGAPMSSTKKAPADAPVVLVGAPEDLGWDAMGELVFRDELHLQQAFAIFNSPEGQRIGEDEEAFCLPDRTKVVLTGERKVV